MNREDELKKKHAPVSHWYLFMLGIDPEAQGQGAGSSLLAAKFREAAQKEAESPAYYLEIMNERNIPLYEKHGFHVCEEVKVGAKTAKDSLFRL